jgi:hypothetical protein
LIVSGKKILLDLLLKIDDWNEKTVSCFGSGDFDFRGWPLEVPDMQSMIEELFPLALLEDTLLCN